MIRKQHYTEMSVMDSSVRHAYLSVTHQFTSAVYDSASPTVGRLALSVKAPDWLTDDDSETLSDCYLVTAFYGLIHTEGPQCSLPMMTHEL